MPLLQLLTQRNILVLLAAQCLFVSGTVLLVTIGGIAGHRMAPAESLATLPMSLMVVGTAFATLPAGYLSHRLGRRSAFQIGATLAFSGTVIGGFALGSGSFWMFCLGAALQGSSLGFSQQFRFAAAESVPERLAPYAVSIILVGSIGGAMIGPALATTEAWWEGAAQFQAALWLGSACFVVAFLILSLLRIVHSTTPQEHAPTSTTSPWALFLAPLVLVAVLSGMVGQGVMTFVMTATPVSMHVVDGHSLVDTASVVRAHVIAMYLPSLITGTLIATLGIPRVLLLGAAVTACTVALGLAGHAYLHYWGSLVLLGIGWNFLFTGGTTLLIANVAVTERIRAQAVNDFCVFGASATASLFAGVALLSLGWSAVLWLALVPVLGMAVAVMCLPRSVTRAEA